MGSSGSSGAVSSNTLILKTNMNPAGHGGASGRYDRLKETVFDYAYFLTQMGIQN
jgi:oligopeptidase B